jgi:nucleoside 2-deoxyribosyltransferase
MKATIYLAGPIHGCSDVECVTWRREVKELLPEFEFLDPMDKDYRGRENENVNEIVEGDKSEILRANILLAYCWQKSWGTAMEIMYARGHRTYVVVVGRNNLSPWVRYYADKICHSLGEACDFIREKW